MITYRLSKGHISNVIATAKCVKLKPLKLDERNILLIKRQYANTITSNVNTTTVTASTTMPRGMKVKLLMNFEGGCELNHSTPSVCWLSKGCNSNMLVNSLVREVKTNTACCEGC